MDLRKIRPALNLDQRLEPWSRVKPHIAWLANRFVEPPAVIFYVGNHCFAMAFSRFACVFFGIWLWESLLPRSFIWISGQSCPCSFGTPWYIGPHTLRPWGMLFPHWFHKDRRSKRFAARFGPAEKGPKCVQKWRKKLGQILILK